MITQKCDKCSESSDVSHGSSFPIYYAKAKTTHHQTMYSTEYSDLGKRVVFFCKNCNEISKKKNAKVGKYILVSGVFIFLLALILNVPVLFGWSRADWIQFLGTATCMIGTVGILMGVLMVAIGARSSLNEESAKNILKSDLGNKGYNSFMTEKEFREVKRTSHSVRPWID
jgi:uncharacterized membrane protein YcjF (UPF0283 family)